MFCIMMGKYSTVEQSSGPFPYQEMEARYLNGEDSNVDYAEIDANVQLDDHWVDLQGRDAEDAFFADSEIDAEEKEAVTAAGCEPMHMDVEDEHAPDEKEEWERMADKYAEQCR